MANFLLETEEPVPVTTTSLKNLDSVANLTVRLLDAGTDLVSKPTEVTTNVAPFAALTLNDPLASVLTPVLVPFT